MQCDSTEATKTKKLICICIL